MTRKCVVPTCNITLRTGRKYCYKHRKPKNREEAIPSLMSEGSKGKLLMVLIFGLLIGVPLIIILVETKPNFYQIFIGLIFIILFALIIRREVINRKQKFNLTS